MRAAHALLLGCVLLGAVTAHVRQDKIPPNRCLPGQNCFPSRQVLKEFAATLTGDILQPFDAGYSAVVNLNNARLTRHPYLIVMAQSVTDVQRAMKFARKYQLMVFSQVSVDGASSRNTYDGAMQINLSRMTSISGLRNATSRSEFGEVKAEAGASWDSVYSQARTISRDVVTGDDINWPVGDTVGSGAIGPLVKVYGLVSDNLLEVEIVTADGNLVTVDEYNVEVNFGEGLQRRTFDKSLFAAIAEGGIGPWGIVVSYTFKLHPAPLGIVHVVARYKLWEAGTYVGQNVLNFLSGAIPILPVTWGGFINIDGGPSATEPEVKGVLELNVFYYGLLGATADYYFIDTITAFDASQSLISLTVNNRSSVQDYSRLQANLPQGRYYGFSTFVQYDKILNTEDGGEKFADVLLFALNNPTIESRFRCYGQLLGGASLTAARNFSLANPALRTSYLALSCALGWDGTGLEDSYYVDHALDYAAMFAPYGEGKYLGWVEDDLADWKHQLHGDKYSHLIDVKIRYDIDNFLWCPNCVGSDFRTDCRYNSNHRGLMITGYLASHRQHMRMRRRKMSRLQADHEVRHPYISMMTMED